MNEDRDITSLVKKIGDSIEEFSDRIDTFNLIGIFIGILHAIGEDSGYKRSEWNHIIKDLIKKNYRIK